MRLLDKSIVYWQMGGVDFFLAGRRSIDTGEPDPLRSYVDGFKILASYH